MWAQQLHHRHAHQRFIGGAMNLGTDTMSLSAGNERNLTVDGITINIHTMDDAVASIVSAAQRDESFHVCTMNLDHVRHLNANTFANPTAGHASSPPTAFRSS
jgi:hypothetical protein